MRLIYGRQRNIRDELVTWSQRAKPFQAAKTAKFLDLLDYLESRPGPQLYVDLILDELWLTSPESSRQQVVQVAVDWLDYGQVQDGVPIMHYRLQVRHGQRRLSTERRTRAVEEVEQFVREVFR